MTTIDIPKINAAALREAFPSVLGTCQYMDIGVGWRGIVQEMCLAFDSMPRGTVTVYEMTQKMAGLRVWVGIDGLSRDQRSTVLHAKVLAEERSRCICEVCGEDGYIKTPPPENEAAWIYCLCHRHLPRERRGWPLLRRNRRYRIGDAYWEYYYLLDCLRVSEGEK